MGKSIRLTAVLAFLAVTLGLIGHGVAQQPRTPAAVDQQRLENADREPGQWMSYGRDLGRAALQPADPDQRQATSARLGLAWYADLNTYRGVEATPLVIDGVLYNVSAWNIVTAYDARDRQGAVDLRPQGRRAKWARSPAAARSAAASPRGRARSIIATLDGRLIALDAQDRQAGLDRRDLRHRARPYSITGAPRVFDGKVVIGNGGARLRRARLRLRL